MLLVYEAARNNYIAIIKVIKHSAHVIYMILLFLIIYAIML
jgi:hypothetical protein